MQAEMTKDSGVEVGLHTICSVLRNDFSMRHRKVKKVPWLGNTERCLVTRQLYAKKMLSLLEEGKRIINIDESWLNYLDFRCRKWRLPGDNNSIATKDLSPKINMIAALDTEGRIYLSLT